MKNKGLGKHSRHKKSRTSNRMYRQAFKSWKIHEQQISHGHTWKWSTHRAQAPPTCTQPIQGGRGLKVKKDMV